MRRSKNSCFEVKAILVLVSRLDFSQGRICLGARLVQALWGWTCLRAELSKTLGPELSKNSQA